MFEDKESEVKNTNLESEGFSNINPEPEDNKDDVKKDDEPDQQGSLEELKIIKTVMQPGKDGIIIKTTTTDTFKERPDQTAVEKAVNARRRDLAKAGVPLLGSSTAGFDKVGSDTKKDIIYPDHAPDHDPEIDPDQNNKSPEVDDKKKITKDQLREMIDKSDIDQKGLDALVQEGELDEEVDINAAHGEIEHKEVGDTKDPRSLPKTPQSDSQQR